jgi:ADP-ribosyl-[dinitrogen reductase] hydrolase
LLNKIRGGLFGLACGDALGCTTEFMTPKEIKTKFGIHSTITGGGPFHFLPGEVTDDTDMAICVAKGILRAPHNPIEAIGQEFLNWEAKKPKDIGMTIMQAISFYDEVDGWAFAAKRAHDVLGQKSAGNGSVMRVLPVALAYNNPSMMMRIAHAQSKLTHYDNAAADACVIYTKIAYRLLRGEPLLTALTSEIEATRYISALYEKPVSTPDAYVVHTMEWMVHILTTTDSYLDAIVVSANAGYDSDTLAAMVGGLAGIYYGYDSIPTDYIDSLLLKKEIDALAKDIFALKEELN